MLLGDLSARTAVAFALVVVAVPLLGWSLWPALSSKLPRAVPAGAPAPVSVPEVPSAEALEWDDDLVPQVLAAPVAQVTASPHPEKAPVESTVSYIEVGAAARLWGLPEDLPARPAMSR